MAQLHDGKKYFIMNVGTKTVVDLDNGSAQNGAKVQGWEFQTKAPENLQHQMWIAKFEGRSKDLDWYSFTNRDSGTALDNAGGGSNLNNKVQGWAYAGNLNQQWAGYPLKGKPVPYYVLYNRAPMENDGVSRCLDLYGGKPTNGTSISMFNPPDRLGDNLNQVWILIEAVQ